MRKRILLTGVILLLLGIFLIYGGGSIVKVLADSTATTSQKFERWDMSLNVPSNNFSSPVPIDLSVDKLRSFQVSYTTDGVVNLYVMSQSEFEVWKSKNPTKVELYVFGAKNGNFSLIPDQDGIQHITYYLVFDNKGLTSVSVGLSFSRELEISETSPFISYLPFEFIIIGLVLTWPGLGGKPKIPARDRATLERIAVSLGIDPKRLSDKQLRKQISEAT